MGFRCALMERLLMAPAMVNATTKRLWTRMGAGPRWALPVAAYFVVAVGVHAGTYPRFVMSICPAWPCTAIGLLLLLTGAILYASAWVSLRGGLRDGRLVTSGLYRTVRHPLYASAVFFIIPGVAVVSRSWLLLPMPLLAYASLRICLPAEDNRLQERFGEGYGRYKSQTPALWPRLVGRRASNDSV